MALRDWLAAREQRRWAAGCSSLGPGAVLRGQPKIINRGRIEIGARFHLSSSPVQSHLVTWKNATLGIGDDVTIGHGAAIACLARIEIGAGTRAGPFLVLADSDFHVAGDRSAVPEPKPISIGRAVQIGNSVNILPGAVIGDGAIVLGGSTVAGNIPAGITVSGVPARVARAQPGGDRGHRSSLPNRITALVAQVLGLPALPALTDGPEQLEGWDSLGTLRLLLAVEDDCQIRLDEKAMARVSSVGELIGLIEARLAA